MSERIVYYRFLHQHSKIMYSINIGNYEFWQDIRYLIEKKYHMHLPCKSKLFNSYIVGWINNNTLNKTPDRTLNTLLQKDSLIPGSSFLFLARKPFTEIWHKPYLPPRFRETELKPNASPQTEEDIMKNLEQDTHHQLIKPLLSVKRKWYLDDHVADLKIEAPRNYVCKICNQSGHYFELCPQRTETGGYKIRKNPSGIPKTFLKPATTREEQANAFQTSTGELLILKK